MRNFIYTTLEVRSHNKYFIEELFKEIYLTQFLDRYSLNEPNEMLMIINTINF